MKGGEYKYSIYMFILQPGSTEYNKRADAKFKI